jgi:glucokinase
MDGAVTRHLGLDLGGTTIKWVVLQMDAPNDQEPRVLSTGEAPTRRDLRPLGVVRQLVDLAEGAAEDGDGVTSVGVGVPGLFDAATGRTRLIPNLDGDWAGVPIADPIGAALRAPVSLINDARAFTLAESVLGAGRGLEVVLGITIGTGIGGGIALGGRIYQGHDGTAGEIGHQTVLLDGLPCTCGNHGCLETLASGRALAAVSGQPNVERAVVAASMGDARASHGFQTCGRYLGVGLANAIVLLTPDRVVVGGGVAQAGDLLLNPAREEVQRRVRVTELSKVSVVTARLGIWAGAIGAALHAAQGGTGAISAWR